jgi:hypothetical protein
MKYLKLEQDLLLYIIEINDKGEGFPIYYNDDRFACAWDNRPQFNTIKYLKSGWSVKEISKEECEKFLIGLL